VVCRFGNALKYVNSPKKMDLLSTMPPLRIVVTNTRVPKNTKSLVAGVRVLHDALPAVVDPMLSAINEISETFAKSITERVNGSLFETITRLVKLNQGLLVGLGVGHASLDVLVATSSKYGVCD
jgi:mevalonate kinase